MRSLLCFILVLLAVPGFSPAEDTAPLRVLIITGRNNHDWRRTTPILKETLEVSGRFAVTVSTCPPSYPEKRPRETPNMTDAEKIELVESIKAWDAANRAHEDAQKAAWDTWRPDFLSCDVVVNDYNGGDWPDEVKAGLVEFVNRGGGLVNVHAANNAFGGWPEFNDMLGLGYRPPPFGRRLVIDPETGEPMEIAPGTETGKGVKSGHGSKHEFTVINRRIDHPILANLPVAWRHGKDELYHGQRGPAEHLNILASAYSDPKQGGSDFHEPVLWTVDYGKGRVVTTSLGHVWTEGQEDTDALHCVGFQTLLARSAEWAATGTVTIPVPDGFPYAHRVSLSTPEKTVWKGAAASVDTMKPGEMRFPIRTPEESTALIELPPGYRADAIASEPDIEEPVWIAWDANGALYVAEMNSYMQDAHGTGTKETKNGRIKRLEDTDGDGIMDRVTVFADNLLLPRMILPLDERILIQETDDASWWSLRDTTGDGVADERLLVKEGRKPQNSVEHQDSALTWGLDNWIYTAQGGERVRYAPGGEWKTEKILNEFNQWGMGMDDLGTTYYSQNSIPGRGFQQPWIYWNLIGEKNQWKRFERPNLGPDTDAAFQLIYPIFPVGDRQENMGRSWTSACGLSIYRGDALPGDEMGGAMMLCEPCSHTVRRARVENGPGGVSLKNIDGEAEFFASRDFYTRPVATATGPDGCLYVVDMYRGIIQDSPWVGPEFVERIESMGMDKVIRHGRLYRISHEKQAPGERPRMLDQTPAELVPHLAHANGWWRDTAQRLLILRGDRSVVPALETFAKESPEALGRVHALWTLEGLEAMTAEIAGNALSDPDARVRQTALRLHEPWLKSGDAAALAKVRALADDEDLMVRRQVVLSLGWSADSAASETIQKIAESNVTDGSIFLATLTALYGQTELPLVAKVRDGSLFRDIPDTKIRTETQARWKAGLKSWEGKPARPRTLDPEALSLVEKGTEIYAAVCTVCHGPDGQGVVPPGLTALAPPLVDSPRVNGPKEALVRILMHGLMGPLDGKTYQAGLMAPLGHEQNDDWCAAVLTYIRQEWTNDASVIRPAEVAAIRESSQDRKAPWTEAEIAEFSAPLIEDRTGWIATGNGHTPANAIDGNGGGGHDHAWHSQNSPGAWLAVDFGKPLRLTHLVMECTDPDFYPRSYEIRVSGDGKEWSEPIATGQGHGIRTQASFEPVITRHLKIIQTGNAVPRWMVAELRVHGEPVP